MNPQTEALRFQSYDTKSCGRSYFFTLGQSPATPCGLRIEKTIRLTFYCGLVSLATQQNEILKPFELGPIPEQVPIQILCGCATTIKHGELNNDTEIA
jgi:hypothetical protein